MSGAGGGVGGTRGNHGTDGGVHMYICTVWLSCGCAVDGWVWINMYIEGCSAVAGALMHGYVWSTYVHTARPTWRR